MFRRVLIANRGEIAVRILRACRELGCAVAAVYSEADAQAVHVRLADASALLGPPEPAESYLRGEKVIAAAHALGCDAVHPGYGFLAENADFAQAVLDAGLTWIGPPPDAMRRMGLKVGARQVARQAGSPLVPGYEGTDATDDELIGAASEVGYPLLVKASAGGGGKGMRLVHAAGELPDALRGARREAQSAFGNATVYLERYIENPRHIEVQILADQHGNVTHLGERECSIQRRHQKLIEETPSVAVNDELRERLCSAAVNIAKAAGYVGAGTIEFILAPDGEFYFLEMNTRLQVEHPVTELVYGLDLVQWQLRIAAGEALTIDEGRLTNDIDQRAPDDRQSSIGNRQSSRGHSIEVRITAEDPAQHFLPQTGRIELLQVPHAPGVRFDHALRAGLEVSPYYDSLLGKLIVWHETRAGAIARLQQALRELRILGVPTNIGFLQDVVAHPAFLRGDLHTGFVDEHFPEWQSPQLDEMTDTVAKLLLSEKPRRLAGDNGRPPTVWESTRAWSNT